MRISERRMTRWIAINTIYSHNFDVNVTVDDIYNVLNENGLAGDHDSTYLQEIISQYLDNKEKVHAIVDDAIKLVGGNYMLQSISIAASCELFLKIDLPIIVKEYVRISDIWGRGVISPQRIHTIINILSKSICLESDIKVNSNAN